MTTDGSMTFRMAGSKLSARHRQSPFVSRSKSIAMSNISPTVSDAVPPPMPLNAFADVASNQRFTLSIAKSNNPGVDFSGVSDVALAVEFQADLN